MPGKRSCNRWSTVSMSSGQAVPSGAAMKKVSSIGGASFLVLASVREHVADPAGRAGADVLRGARPGLRFLECEPRRDPESGVAGSFGVPRVASRIALVEPGGHGG